MWLQPGEPADVVVLLHGFTNTPRQYAVLGEELYADGWTVLAPRFPYHGYRDRRTRAIAQLRAEDVIAATIAAVRHAARIGRRIAVLGISAGGTAALWAGNRLAIDLAVGVSPFFGIRLLGGVNGPVHRTIEAFPNAFLWWDPIRHERSLPAHVYPQFSTHALAEMLRLDDFFVRPGADHARRVALVLNHDDPLVSNVHAVRRCELFTRAGIPFRTLDLRGLPPQHDIIEPTLAANHIGRVYPMLRALLRGEGWGTAPAKRPP